MGKEPIHFDEYTARHLKDTFSLTASSLDAQVTRRKDAAEMILTDFKGPYADTYRSNSEQAVHDLAAISHALREVAYIVDRAIEAYHEAQAEQECWWQELLENVKEGLGMGEEESVPAPPAPNLPGVFSLAAVQKVAPSISSVSVVSGNPEQIRRGVTTLRSLDVMISDRPGYLHKAVAAYAEKCPWAIINVGNVITEFENWLEDNGNEFTWLDNIANAFESIPGNSSGVVSAPYSTMHAAVGTSAGVPRRGVNITSPTIQGTEASAGYIGDPVNAATGNFIEPETDLLYTGATSALTFTRMYNAMNSQAGLFGTGWSSLLDSRLILSDEKATWVKEDGQHLIFPRAGESWERAQLHALWLTKEAPSKVALALASEHSHFEELLVVRDNAGSCWAFSPAGIYLGHRAGDGDAITLSYNGQQHPVRITHTRGRFIDIEYSSGRVAYIQGHEGTRVEYTYDQAGCLTEVGTAAGTRTYTYNEAGLISAVTAADGTVEVENTYDKLGRVASQNYPHGVVRRYSYLPNGVTLVTNDDGSHANTWVSDEHGRLIGMIDANQKRQSMSYDTFNNRVSVTERDGATTARLFNKRGLLTREVTPEGADITCEYDEHDRLITMITATGAVLSYEYADSTGEQRTPSVLVDALGGRTEMVWSNGLLMNLLGPTGVGLAFTYDVFGDILGVTNTAGDTTRFERDAAGRVTSIVTPLGARTMFTYDAAGQLVSREDADGALWRFTYGVGGRINEVKDPAGAVTKYEYGLAGEVVAVVDPLGRRTERTFDSMGNVNSLTSPSGATWAFTYDELMQNVGVVDPLGNMWGREFDVNGEVTALIDPTGVRTSTQMNRASGIRTITDAFGSYTTHFDAYGRPVKESAPDGSEEIFTYDAAGNVVEILDAEGQLTVIGRDARGEITSITSPEGRVTSFTYDECGRPWTMTDPAGVVTTLTYDADSRVISRVSSSGTFENLTYDALGRVLTQRTHTGVARYGYDACGRVTSAFDTKFGRRRFAYDAAGQLVKAVNGLGGVTRFEYTADGLLAARTDPNGSVTRFTYDSAGQLVSTVNPLGQVTKASYDAAGRLVATVNPDGDELSYSYDTAGLLEKSFFNQQLITRVERDTQARTVRVCDHTAFGTGLVPEGTAPTVHTFTYDRLGRTAQYTRVAADSLRAEGVSAQDTGTPDTTISYGYTPDGAVASMTVDGVRTDYTYASGTGLLTSALRSAAPASSATDEHQAYGTESMLAEELTYHYDAATASLLKITDARGNLVRSFDAVPTVVPEADTVESGKVRYRADGGWATVSTNTHPVTGKLVEFTTYYNHLGLVIGAEDEVDGLRLYTYDDAHQLTSVRSEAGTHTFTYSPAGFLTEETTPEGVTRTYAYNGAGQLTDLHDSVAGSCHYVYDGLGRRLRVTDADGQVTEYAYNTTGGLPSHISTATPTTSQTTSQSPDTHHASAFSPLLSVWVDALGQVAGVRSSSETGATSCCFLSWDVASGVPSVLSVGGVPVSLGAGVSAVATGVRGVDPFGVSAVAGFQFAGSQSGPDGVAPAAGVVGVTAAGSLALAGLEVLGARVYDPVVRGFISVDPLASPVGAGWAANPYAFVGNAPVGLVDPWGLSPMSAAEFREYRADVRGRAVERAGKGLADFARDNAGWIALGVAALGVAALAVSGPIGWGILTGMAISGGMELGSQLLSGDPLDWRKIATSASIGGIAGGFGAGIAGAVSKVGSKVFTSVASRFTARANGVGQQISQVFRKVATNPATKNSVPRIVSGLKQTQISLQQQAAHYTSWAARFGSVGFREGVGAYAEAGMDTMLTYIADGHHVTADGLVKAWGVPAFSNAFVPKPVSKGFDSAFQKLGWEASEGISAKFRGGVSDAIGNFSNGAISYSGAPMTYSPQYESYQGKDYDGPGWDGVDAFNAGLKEIAKGSASASRPVESLKSVTFEARPVNGGLDYAGMVRDTAFLGTGLLGVEVATLGMFQKEKGAGNE